MVPKTFGTTWIWLLATASAVAQTTAAQAAAAAPAVPYDAARSADTRETVEVIVVGAVPNGAELDETIEELLQAQGSSHWLRHQAELNESDLLESSDRTDSALIRIWITVPDPRRARLWFAAPGLNRYLWREIPLPRGFDAVAREQIAHVVQSSSEILSWHDEGLTRDDARRAWQQQARRRLEEAGERASKGASPTHSVRPSIVFVRRDRFALAPKEAPDRLRFAARVGYGSAYSAPGLGALHGPALEVGADRMQARFAVGLRLAYEWHFEQRFVRSPAKLDLNSQAGWVLLVGRYAASRNWGWTSGVGLGVELTGVAPKAVGSSRFIASESYVDRAYWLRLRTGVVAGLVGPLGWFLESVVDLSLSKTSFGIDTDEGYEELLSPWYVRPGVQLGLVFQ